MHRKGQRESQGFGFIELSVIRKCLPFAWAKFRRACPVFGASCNVTHAQGSKWILLLALVSQGGGTQIEDQIQAVQQAPRPQQLKVLIVL